LRLLRLYGSELRHLFRIKWLWSYFLTLFLSSMALFYASGDESKVLLSLLSVSLLVVPLVSAFFGISYYYDSRSFAEFLLAQPLRREEILLSQFGAVATVLVSMLWAGVLLPFLPHLLTFGEKVTLLLLLTSGTLVSLSFLALAFLVGVLVEDKAKGVSAVLALWLYLTLLHDALILTVVYLFRDYPLEKPVLLLTLLNPVDLSRLLVILNMDVAALMGLTGAVFKELLGSGKGMILAFGSLLLWTLLPLLGATFIFRRKDL